MNDPAGPRTGTRFGPYELRSLLGKGGMGEVYEAYDTVKDRVVAVKLLPRNLADDPTYQERFRRESHAAARLREPHVVPIHDWGEIDGVLYIDMRLVQGRTLRALLTADGAVEPERAVAIVEQVAAALDAAHADGLVHRDIKPENVIVTADDFAYLLDFGIAHSVSDQTLTAHGSAIGSYAYMAPERFDDRPVTPQADVYSLACLLAELLTGERPFRAASVSQVIRAHLTAPPPRPSMLRKGFPSGLDDVVASGMAKEPAQRYGSAGELARAARAALTPTRRNEATAVEDRTTDPTQLRPLEGYGSASDIAARTMPPPPVPFYGNPIPPPRRSNLVPVAVTLLVVALIGLAATVGWLLLRPTPDGSAGSPSTVTARPAVDAGSATVAGPPPGSQPCGAVYGPAGPFTGSAAGTSVTSCPFAEEVRRAYAASGPVSAQPRSVIAASPVTGLTYSMTCSANGGLVTCTGGDNAVVYVY